VFITQGNGCSNFVTLRQEQVPGKRWMTWAIALLVTFVMFQPDVLRYFSLRLECESFMLSVA